MVAYQIINKILQSKSLSIYEDNSLTPDHFVGYEDKIGFILDHYNEYGNVPDVETFLSHFTDEKGNCSFEMINVEESNKYLVDTLKEEYLYYQSVPVLQKMAELMKTDSNAAVEYMQSQMDALQPSSGIGGIDIIAHAKERLADYLDRKSNPDQHYFESGFKELDEVTHGIKRGGELIILAARINTGKSWILEKMATHVWQTGFNVGYISPEMTAMDVGFRFDSLFAHFSNRGLAWGSADINEEEYTSYLDTLLKKDNKFIVATPSDFSNALTISRLKTWIKQNKLDFVGIDGVSFLKDENGKKSDNKTTELSNISQDLMNLSIELGVPFVAVAQLNRGGVENQGLDTIRDSDGIAMAASKVLFIKQLADNMLELLVNKQRTGRVGDKFHYQWTIDTSDFVYVPNYEVGHNDEKAKDDVIKTKKKFADKEDLF